MAINFKPATYLFAFTNGSYKRITFTEYAHNEWIKMTKPDGSLVFVNPANVKYIESIVEAE
jgi:hypothetical protein